METLVNILLLVYNSSNRFDLELFAIFKEYFEEFLFTKSLDLFLALVKFGSMANCFIYQV